MLSRSCPNERTPEHKLDLDVCGDSGRETDDEPSVNMHLDSMLRQCAESNTAM